MVHAQLRRPFGGSVSATVVDDQHFDLVDAVDLARQVGDRFRQRFALVEAGNLNDELHGPPEAKYRPLVAGLRWTRNLGGSFGPARLAGASVKPRADAG